MSSLLLHKSKYCKDDILNINQDNSPLSPVSSCYVVSRSHWTAMENSSTLSFVLPPYLSDNNSPTLFHPTYQTLKDIELRVLDIFHTNKISKRSLSESRRHGRRYLVYDRPPQKKKEKKRKRKCPSSNGISALTFLNFAIGAVSLAANVVNSINSNDPSRPSCS